MGRDELEKGNKVLLPASVLAEVSQGAMPHPLLFRINSMRTKTTTYVGVLEFTAPEDVCVLPMWVRLSLFFLKKTYFLKRICKFEATKVHLCLFHFLTCILDFWRNGINGRRVNQHIFSTHCA